MHIFFFFFFAYCNFKTNKFDWTPNDIRKEKISYKIFPLLIKKENAGISDWGLIDPNLGHEIFFGGFSSTRP